MSAGMLGYILGLTMGCLLLPVLILIVAKFVGPMKRSPKIVYSVCAVLVLLAAFGAGRTGGGYVVPAAISATLALLALW
jgi:hypothetical protein